MVLSTIIKLHAPHRRQALIRIWPSETLVRVRVVTPPLNSIKTFK